MAPDRVPPPADIADVPEADPLAALLLSAAANTGTDRRVREWLAKLLGDGAMGGDRPATTHATPRPWGATE